MLKQTRVVDAVIVNGGQILYAQREPEVSLAGMWEFPGGKFEPDETARDALAREIAEELDGQVVVGDDMTTTVHGYDCGVVTLTKFHCGVATGRPRPTEYADSRWLATHEVSCLEWAPADIPTVAFLEAGAAHV